MTESHSKKRSRVWREIKKDSLLARRAVEKSASEVTEADRKAVHYFLLTLLGSGTRIRYLRQSLTVLRNLVKLDIYRKEAHFLLKWEGVSGVHDSLERFGNCITDEMYNIPPRLKAAAMLYLELRTKFIRKLLSEEPWVKKAPRKSKKLTNQKR